MRNVETAFKRACPGVGTLVLVARTHLGLTHAVLSRKLSLTGAELSDDDIRRVEHQERDLTLREMRAMAATLRMDSGKFMELADQFAQCEQQLYDVQFAAVKTIRGTMPKKKKESRKVKRVVAKKKKTISAATRKKMSEAAKRRHRKSANKKDESQK